MVCTEGDHVRSRQPIELRGYHAFTSKRLKQITVKVTVKADSHGVTLLLITCDHSTNPPCECGQGNVIEVRV